MSKGLEINVEMGLCTKDMAKENPIKDFEILIEEYKDKWSTQMYDYFKECLSIIKKELEDYQEVKTYMQQYGIENIKELRRVLHNNWVICQKFKTDTAYVSKALEIIKREPSMVGWQVGYEDYEDYLDNTPEEQRFIENKEEFDLLKEVLL